MDATPDANRQNPTAVDYSALIAALPADARRAYQAARALLDTGANVFEVVATVSATLRKTLGYARRDASAAVAPARQQHSYQDAVSTLAYILVMALDAGPMPTRTPGLDLECLECGEQFLLDDDELDALDDEAECPACGSTDVEPSA